MKLSLNTFQDKDQPKTQVIAQRTYRIMRSHCNILQDFVLLSLYNKEGNKQIYKKNNEKVIRKSGEGHEKNIRNARKSHEKATRKPCESQKKVIIKSGERYAKVLRNTGAGQQKGMRKL